MEMVLVASTVANDGIMMQPMLVKEILSSKGKSLEKLQPKQLGQVMTKENATTMKGLMRAVVTGGTGTSAALPGIEVSGKTGTADHVEASKQEAPHAWFTGFAPYDDPQIAIAVIVEEGGQGGQLADDPQIAIAVIVEEGGQGGQLAATITRELVRTYLK